MLGRVSPAWGRLSLWTSRRTRTGEGTSKNASSSPSRSRPLACDLGCVQTRAPTGDGSRMDERESLRALIQVGRISIHNIPMSSSTKLTALALPSIPDRQRRSSRCEVKRPTTRSPWRSDGRWTQEGSLHNGRTSGLRQARSVPSPSHFPHLSRLGERSLWWLSFGMIARHLPSSDPQVL